MGSFAEDVVVEPCGGGRYHGQLDHSWDLVAVPHGGIVASLALRAAGLEVGDPGPFLRTWDENGTLVAYATQMMFFTYLPD